MEISNKEKNFISAVIYCYNDEDRIGSFIKNLYETLDSFFLKYEIIIVNDCSTDNSTNVIRDFAAGKENLVVNLINMSYFQGLETSMNAGVNLAIGDFVYEFDSVYDDYSWNMLMDIYRHSLSGYDIVSASVKSKSKLSSKLFYRVFNKYSHIQYNIGTESFRIISRRAINRVHSITQTVPYRKAAYANCGLAMSTLTYIPTSIISRKKHKDKKRVAVDSLILYTDVAYRVTVSMAISMFLLSVAFIVYALLFKFFEEPIEGWTTTVIFSSIGFGGLFIILAMIIKYMQMLVKLSFRKKDFIIESIQKLQ